MAPAHWTVLLILASIPLLDIFAVMIVGRWIGFWPTIAVLGASAVLGIQILRHRSRALLAKAFLAPGAILAGQAGALDDTLLIAAGVLFVYPGNLSDAVALVLLHPGARRAAASAIGATVTPPRTGQADCEAASEADRQDGPVIEVDFRRISERPISPAPDGPPAKGD